MKNYLLAVRRINEIPNTYCSIPPNGWHRVRGCVWARLKALCSKLARQRGFCVWLCVHFLMFRVASLTSLEPLVLLLLLIFFLLL